MLLGAKKLKMIEPTHATRPLLTYEYGILEARLVELELTHTRC